MTEDDKNARGRALVLAAQQGFRPSSRPTIMDIDDVFIKPEPVNDEDAVLDQIFEHAPPEVENDVRQGTEEDAPQDDLQQPEHPNEAITDIFKYTPPLSTNKGQARTISGYPCPAEPLAMPVSYDIPTVAQWKGRRKRGAKLYEGEKEEENPQELIHKLSAREDTIRLAGKLANFHYDYDGKRNLGWTPQTELAKQAPSLFNSNNTLKIGACIHDLYNKSHKDFKYFNKNNPLPWIIYRQMCVSGKGCDLAAGENISTILAENTNSNHRVYIKLHEDWTSSMKTISKKKSVRSVAKPKGKLTKKVVQEAVSDQMERSNLTAKVDKGNNGQAPNKRKPIPDNGEEVAVESSRKRKHASDDKETVAVEPSRKRKREVASTPTENTEIQTLKAEVRVLRTFIEDINKDNVEYARRNLQIGEWCIQTRLALNGMDGRDMQRRLDIHHLLRENMQLRQRLNNLDNLEGKHGNVSFLTSRPGMDHNLRSRRGSVPVAFFSPTSAHDEVHHNLRSRSVPLAFSNDTVLETASSLAKSLELIKVDSILEDDVTQQPHDQDRDTTETIMLESILLQ
jgi:hypothetical protein